jgi:hypothetical protein
MRIVIDTSSLSALVRYYLPFDKDDLLKMFIRGKIDAGEIIILDKVVEEAKYQGQGIVLKVLDFLNQKSIQTKSNELLPYTKFFNMLENQFCVHVQRKKISDIEFEIKKKEYLESADAKLILYCLKDKGLLEIDNCNLTTLIKDHFKMDLSKYLK